MKVKDLIAVLLKEDQEKEILICGPDSGGYDWAYCRSLRPIRPSADGSSIIIEGTDGGE